MSRDMHERYVTTPWNGKDEQYMACMSLECKQNTSYVSRVFLFTSGMFV